MKRLAMIMLMLAAFLMLTSCDSKSESDPDKLMDEILIAGRAGDYDKLDELLEQFHEQKVTIRQARRYIFEIEPKMAFLDYEGGSWNEDGYYDGGSQEPFSEECEEVLKMITDWEIEYSQPNDDK